MLNVTLKLEGLDELIEKWDKRPELLIKALDFVVKKNAEEIRAKAKARAPVLTGTLRRSIDKEPLATMLYAVFSDNVPYARLRNYVNNLHPETVGYLTKTLFEQREQFVRDIEEAVRELKKL